MAVVEAIGYIVHLVSPAQLDSQLPKLLPLIAQLYKKHQEHYYISQVTMATVSPLPGNPCVEDTHTVLIHTVA